jgi:lipopolysaccharide export system protein LptA
VTGLLLAMVLLAASPGGAATVSDVELDLWLPDQPALRVQADQVTTGEDRQATLSRPRVSLGSSLGLVAEDGLVDLDGGTVRADGAVHATLATGEPVEIRSEHFDLDVRAGTGTFTGAVVVTHGELVVTCERLEVTFDTDHQAIQTVVALGGVEIRQGDRLGRGERAEFDVEPGTVVLSGSPYLEQGSVRLRGTVIRFDIAGGEVACSGCRAVFGERR